MSDRYEVHYINGWCVCLMNPYGISISTVWSRHSTKKEAMEALQEPKA